MNLKLHLKPFLQKNEAVLYQSQASDQWNFYQAKSVKSHIYAVNAELFPEKAEEFKKKVAVYKKEQEEIKAEAERIEALKEARNAASDHYYHIHHILSFAITFLQISIALASISALTRNKKFWLGSLVLSAIGAAIAGYCLVSYTYVPFTSFSLYLSVPFCPYWGRALWSN
jgi:hypothetical protein